MRFGFIVDVANGVECPVSVGAVFYYEHNLSHSRFETSLTNVSAPRLTLIFDPTPDASIVDPFIYTEQSTKKRPQML